MEVSKFLGPKAIQHTITKYVQKVFFDPYAKIDKMMEKNGRNKNLEEFKGIYDKTRNTW